MLSKGLSMVLISLLQTTFLKVDVAPVYIPTPCDPTPTLRHEDVLQDRLIRDDLLFNSPLFASFGMFLVFIISTLIFLSSSGIVTVLAQTFRIEQWSKKNARYSTALVPLSIPTTIDQDSYSGFSNNSGMTIKASTPDNWYKYKPSPARDCIPPYYRVVKWHSSSVVPIYHQRKPLSDVFGPAAMGFLPAKPQTPPRASIYGPATPPLNQLAGTSSASQGSNQMMQRMAVSASSEILTCSAFQRLRNARPASPQRVLSSIESTFQEEHDQLKAKIKRVEDKGAFTLRENEQMLSSLKDRDERLIVCSTELQRRDKRVQELEREMKGYPAKLRILQLELSTERDNKMAKINTWKRRYDAERIENLKLRNCLDDSRRSGKCQVELIESLSRELEHCAPKVKLLEIQLTDALRELDDAIGDVAEAKHRARMLLQSEHDAELRTSRIISKMEISLESTERDRNECVKALEREILKLQIVLRSRHAYIQTLISREEEPTVHSSLHGGLARPLFKNRHRSF
ncbi:hypothetical protein FRB98_000478 [Tulasnella sp. 332]|nr:hypothetical protein FRB98_000478 [Tulasnella sp. 332]